MVTTFGTLPNPTSDGDNEFLNAMLPRNEKSDIHLPPPLVGTITFLPSSVSVLLLLKKFLQRR